jgi:hypothetical protein
VDSVVFVAVTIQLVPHNDCPVGLEAVSPCFQVALSLEECVLLVLVGHAEVVYKRIAFFNVVLT